VCQADGSPTADDVDASLVLLASKSDPVLAGTSAQGTQTKKNMKNLSTGVPVKRGKKAPTAAQLAKVPKGIAVASPGAKKPKGSDVVTPDVKKPKGIEEPSPQPSDDQAWKRLLKNAHSRAYHLARRIALEEGHDDTTAKQMGREAAKLKKDALEAARPKGGSIVAL